jgi:cytochrome P450
MTFPADPLQATRHPDPYPYYAHWCTTQPPLVFHEGIGLWVASGAAVAEALRHPGLRVRPPAELVPRPLLGTAAGEVFGQLVRMNDGDFHEQHRPEVARTASRWSRSDVTSAAQAATQDLLPRCHVNELLSHVPVQTMARLLGVPTAELDRTVAWVHEFTQGIAAGANASAIASADSAARHLMEQGAREGLDPVRAANRIAFMQQALDATAGLLGNVLVRVCNEITTHSQTGNDALVAQVARADPAVHNTRRFAAADLALAGQRVQSGQGVLVLLVTAECGFGAGPHACPGESIALAIVAAALQVLRDAPGWLDQLPKLVGYRPLPNARIPVFA